jgi:hypothetical protein
MQTHTGTLIDDLSALVANRERGFVADVVGAIRDVAKETSQAEVEAERLALADLYSDET